MDIKPLFWAAFCVSYKVARLQPGEKSDISEKMTTFAQCLMIKMRFNK